MLDSVIALSFDGQSLQTFDADDRPRIMLEIVIGLKETAEVSGSDQVIPHAIGRRPRTRRLDRRQLVLKGYVLGSGATRLEEIADFNDAAASVRELFDPTMAPADLVATLQDGTTYTIAARPLPTLSWSDHGPSAADLSVELESVVPDWTIASGGS